MSSNRTRKPDSGLPDDVSKRLKDVVTRTMTEATAKICDEVSRMFRFANMNEIQAAHQVLTKNGTPMKLDEIVEELKGGGLWRMPTRSQGSGADTELKRSIARAAGHGVRGHSVIVWMDKKRGLIGLTDWRSG